MSNQNVVIYFNAYGEFSLFNFSGKDKYSLKDAWYGEPEDKIKESKYTLGLYVLLGLGIVVLGLTGLLFSPEQGGDSFGLVRRSPATAQSWLTALNVVGIGSLVAALLYWVALKFLPAQQRFTALNDRRLAAAKAKGCVTVVMHFRGSPGPVWGRGGRSPYVLRRQPDSPPTSETQLVGSGVLYLVLEGASLSTQQEIISQVQSLQG